MTVSVNIPQDGSASYCSDIVVTNGGSEAVEWNTTFDIEGSIYQLWNANWEQSGTTVTLSGVEWNKVLQPGASTSSIGFCANR